MNAENFLKEANSVLSEIGESKKLIYSLSEENKLLKRKLLEKMDMIDSLGKTLQEMNQLKNGRSELISQNSILKMKLKEKISQIEVFSSKIDMLTRTLVKGDKFIHDLKASYDTKEKEVDLLSKQIRFLTSDQKTRLTDLKKNIEEDARLIDFLKGKVGELNSLENVNEEKVVESNMRENEIERLSSLVNQFRGKADSLMEINKKLTRENQELEFRLSEAEKSRPRASEVKKIPVGSFIEREIEERMKNPNVKIAGFRLDDLEMNEINAVIKTALAHGDSLNRIKNSLVSCGYKEEKIERCLAFHNN